MNVNEITVIALSVLLVVIPAGLGIASVLFERKVNKDVDEALERAEQDCCCHECCGCHCCVQYEEEECGCCGKPLTECECNCSCHKH